MAFQKEVRVLRSNLDHVTFERDKLRTDLNESNQRSIVLAQEIDDQNARMEKLAHQKIR